MLFGIRARKRKVQVRWCPTPILCNFANGSHIHILSEAVQTGILPALFWHLTLHPNILPSTQTHPSQHHTPHNTISPQPQVFPSLQNPGIKTLSTVEPRATDHWNKASTLPLETSKIATSSMNCRRQPQSNAETKLSPTDPLPRLETAGVESQ